MKLKDWRGLSGLRRLQALDVFAPLTLFLLRPTESVSRLASKQRRLKSAELLNLRGMDDVIWL